MASGRVTSVILPYTGAGVRNMNAAKGRLPDFLFIGAAKSGTISVYHYLKQHPAVFMCPVNECNFFALEQADWNSQYRSPVDRFYIDQHCVTTLARYQELFTGVREHHAIGESSPLYIFSRTAASRIKHHIPNVKIIAVLRHPVDRAFSNYCDLRRSGLEPIADFRDAIRAEPQRRAEGWGPWPFWFYTEMGFYAQQLQLYYDLFGPERIFVGLYEDLNRDAAGLMRRIFQFLEVDSNFTLDTSTRHNLGGIPRFDAVARIMVRPNAAKTVLKTVLPAPVRHRIRQRIAEWNTVKPNLDPELRHELTQMYRPDIDALQHLIGRDLSHWL